MHAAHNKLPQVVTISLQDFRTIAARTQLEVRSAKYSWTMSTACHLVLQYPCACAVYPHENNSCSPSWHAHAHTHAVCYSGWYAQCTCSLCAHAALTLVQTSLRTCTLSVHVHRLSARAALGTHSPHSHAALRTFSTRAKLASHFKAQA